MQRTSDEYNDMMRRSLCFEFSHKCHGVVEYHTVGPRDRALPLCDMHAREWLGSLYEDAD